MTEIGLFDIENKGMGWNPICFSKVLPATANSQIVYNISTNK